MNLIIIGIILILAKGVKLDLESICSEVTGPYGEEVHMEKQCKPGARPCLVKCCGINEVIHTTSKIEMCKSVDQLIKEVPAMSKLKEEMSSFSGLNISTADGKISTKKFKDFNVLYRKEFTSNYGEGCTLKYSDRYVNLTEHGIAEFVLSDQDGLVDDIRETRKAPNFCVEMFAFINKHVPTRIYIYYLRIDNTETEQEDMFIAYGDLVSVFFIILLLVVYGLLEELHNNLHGMLFMSFITSLLFYILLLSTKLLYNYSLDDENDTDDLYAVCKWLSPFAYFCLISSFFWMNAMSFDIWRRFRKSRMISRNGVRKKFFIYSLYAWGVPAIITIIAVVIDNSSLQQGVVYKPAFKICQPDYGLNLARMYKFLPMLVLVTANIVLYVLTIYNIREVKTEVKGFDKNSKHHKKNKNQFIIFIKLSVVMGLNWLFEVAQAFTETDSMPTWLFLVMNVFNIYIGVFVFIIMVCKRAIFVKLCQRFNIENRWTRRSTNSKSTTRTDRSKPSTVTNTKSTDDSIQIKTCVYSTDDTPEIEEQNQLLNPRCIETKV